MRKIDIGSCTKAEFAAWLDEYVAAVEDGSLRAEIDAKVDAELGPEWNAKYGDASWEAALTCIGYGPLPGKPPTPVK